MAVMSVPVVPLPVRRRRVVATARCRDGSAFLFTRSGDAAAVDKQLIRRASSSSSSSSVEEKPQRRRSSAPTAEDLQLPQLEAHHLALLLPGLVANATGVNVLPYGVLESCLPIVAPFSVPQVTPDVWLSNKRALAYSRCIIITVYVQGACAVLKFVSGNMVGGFFEGIQAAMGYYSLMPDGLRLLPTYMMMAGFNGVIGLLQTLQTFNGVPLHAIPPLLIISPVAACMSAYFSWQFCKEIRTISSGLSSDGADDSCFVRFMGGGWWPAFLTSSIYDSTSGNRDQRDDDWGGGLGAGAQGGGFRTYGSGRLGGDGRTGGNFPMFEGSGHRLGGGSDNDS